MTWIRRARLGMIVALVTLLAVGCGDDEPSGPGAAVQMTVDPGSISVPQGGTGSATITITRIGGVGGAVTLAATGFPANVTVTFTPPQLTGTTASAVVDVSVAGSVPLGTYSATISATAQGVDAVTVAFGLTVTAAPDFTIAVEPTAMTIVAGASGNAEVGIERTNFAGEVALALLNPPAGITAIFDQTPTTSDASTLVLSVAANVAAGSYPLTIRGTATGPGTRSAALQVTVPAPPTGGNVEYLFCDVSSAPVFVAFQDGAGAWQAVTGVTSGGATRFAFNLAQGYGGVLMVHQPPDLSIVRVPSLAMSASRFGARVHEYVTDVRYASTAQLAQDGFDTCAASQPTRSVRATVVGVVAGSYGRVSLGGATRIYNGGSSTNPVLFEGVPTGPVDLIGSLTTPGNAPSRLLILRNVAVPSSGTLAAPIDFTGPGSLVPITATVTITGADGDDLEVYTDLVTAKGPGGYWADLSPGPLSTRPWAGFPPGSMAAGELHGITVFASPDDGSGDFRASVKYVGPVADQNLVMGPFLDAPAVTAVAAGAYPRFRFLGTLEPEYDKGAEVYLESAEGSGNFYSIIASSAWLAALGNGLAYDITMPDVAGLAGFPLASRLSAGTNAVSAGGFGFTGAGAFDQRPVLGGEFRAAARNTTIAVP